MTRYSLEDPEVDQGDLKDVIILRIFYSLAASRKIESATEQNCFLKLLNFQIDEVCLNSRVWGTFRG